MPPISPITPCCGTKTSRRDQIPRPRKATAGRSCGATSEVAFLPTPKLLPHPFTRDCVAAGSALPFHVAASRGGLVQNMVRRLDEPGRLQFTQEIASADQTDPLIDDG